MTAFVLEGPDIEELLGRVRAEHGERATIVRAEKVRTGGIAGFFAREHFEVAVSLDGEVADRPALQVSAIEHDRHADTVQTSEPTTLADLVARAERDDTFDRTAHDDLDPVDRSGRLADLAGSLRRSVGRQAPLDVSSPPTAAAGALVSRHPLPVRVEHPTPSVALLDARDQAALAVPTSTPVSASEVPAPRGAGEVLVLLGEGVPVLALAEDAARRLRIPRTRVLVASPDPLVPGLPAARRIEDPAAGRSRTAELLVAGSASIVVVDAPLSLLADETARAWLREMVLALHPTATWAALDRTRDASVNRRWLESLGPVDAITSYDHGIDLPASSVVHPGTVPVGVL